MGRIKEIFERRDRAILSVYYPAGYPGLNDTLKIAKHLQDVGVDMIEIGIPFSDPVADGPVIQEAAKHALENGITLKKLFQQLADLRKEIQIPVLLMGYFNSVLQHGVEAFCKDCARVGIDATIIPDLPIDVYNVHYKKLFERYRLSNVWMISPHTDPSRIQMFDQASNAFLYLLSAAATTGTAIQSSAQTQAYFQRIQEMALKNSKLVGFGVHNQTSFQFASRYSEGAIVGTAFVNLLKEGFDPEKITAFIASLRK